MKGDFTVTILLTVLQVIACVGLIATVLLQSGKSAGLSGSITGGDDNPEDPQSVQLQQAIAENGVAKALEQFSGISADNALAAQILEAYNTVA